MKSYNHTFMIFPEGISAKGYDNAARVEHVTYGLIKLSPGNELPAEIFRKHFYQTDLHNIYVVPTKEIKRNGAYGLFPASAHLTEEYRHHKSLYRSDKPDQIHPLI